jgi:hypothetical protein
MKHELKVKPQYFKALWCGDKTFEIRNNDRNFEERDEVVLKEYGLDPELGRDEYTGREIEGFITYLTNYEQKPGYVVFSFRENQRSES